MNKNIIWGTICECGQECFVLQTEHHPWSSKEHIINIKCVRCGREHAVNREQAALFYNQKIFSLFSDIEGSVVDFGCGGGFLTQYAAAQTGDSKIYAIDPVAECEKAVKNISSDIIFIRGSYKEFSRYLNGKQVNEFISRDVIMFIDDFDDFLNTVTEIVKHRFRALAWYMTESDRIKNNKTPEEMKILFNERGWHVSLSYPNWYAYGYFIDALRIDSLT